MTTDIFEDAKVDFPVKPTVGQTEIPTCDATEEARAIVIGLLEEAGLLVDPAAEYTLHVELGHPAKLTRIYKDTMESPTLSGSPFLGGWQTVGRCDCKCS